MTDKSNWKVGLQLMVEPSLKETLVKMAEKSGRSLSGECRYALTQYVGKKKA